MSLATTIRHQIERYGQSVIVRRRIGTTDQFDSATVTGKVHSYRPDELIGAIRQGDRRVVISPTALEDAGWAGGTPRVLDQVVIDEQTTTVQGCEVRYIAGEKARYEIWVRG